MSKDRVLFNVIGYLFITLLAVACVLPFIMVISGSLTAEESIIQKGYSVFPREFSLNAYRLALKAPEKILRAYGVTTFVTVVGTFLGFEGVDGSNTEAAGENAVECARGASPLEMSENSDANIILRIFSPDSFGVVHRSAVLFALGHKND